MHHRLQKGWAAGLALSWMIAATALAEPPQQASNRPESSAAKSPASQAGSNPSASPETSDWWLGLQCRPVEEGLRAQLGLGETQGLIVEKIVPKSPAEKAGLRRHDVLVSADGKPLKSPLDLIGVVNAAEGKKMAVECVRSGQKDKVTLQPERRPEWARPPQPSAKAIEQAQLLRKWFEQLQSGEPGAPLRFRFIHPGAILPPGAPSCPPLPANVTITISKHGGELARVTVTRDHDRWEVAENELDKLPKDLAPYAKCMLGRTLPDLNDAIQLYELVPDPAELQAGGSPPAAGETAEGEASQAWQQRLEQMNKQLEQLRRSIDQLRREGPH